MDNSLTHYGVLGMKWGVRKDNRAQGSSSSPTKKPSPGKQYRQTVREAEKTRRAEGGREPMISPATKKNAPNLRARVDPNNKYSNAVTKAQIKYNRQTTQSKLNKKPNMSSKRREKIQTRSNDYIKKLQAQQSHRNTNAKYLKSISDGALASEIYLARLRGGSAYRYV